MKYPKILIFFLAAAMSASTLVIADDDDEIPFEEFFLFFELNNTDGDLGIHGKIDGGPWKRVEIEGPDGRYERTLLKVRAKGKLRQQGMTELFFESAEPTFDELDPVDFFKRFKEGEYEAEGRGMHHEEFESETVLSHIMPAPPVVSINTEASAGIEVCQCDEEDLDPGEECPDWPSYSPPVTLSWELVTMSHPDLGTSGVDFTPIVDEDGNGAVRFYEVVIEDGSEDTEFKATHIVPPDTTEWVLSEALLDIFEEGEIKYEILVRTNVIVEDDDELVLLEGLIDGEEGPIPGNVTAIESCFEVD